MSFSNKFIKLKKSLLNANLYQIRYIRQSHSNSESTTSDKQTHFGFENVSEKEKEERVYEVFRNVAEKYDVMNDSMSLGIHRLWKDYFIEKMGPRPGMSLIDVAGGTGDIAFRFSDYIRNSTVNANDNIYQSKSHVTVCDINQSMLDVGKAKALKVPDSNTEMSWLRGNAESLPCGDNMFDCYTVAFGIRNMTTMEKVLSEAYRVLKPGGRFMCLEFSQVTNPIFRKIYDEYSFQVIPVLGQIIADDYNSYKYLVESIRKFPVQDEYLERIKESGFKMARYENLMGGIAAIHSGYKI